MQSNQSAIIDPTAAIMQQAPTNNAIAAISQSAAATETLASIWVAKQFPRNVDQIAREMRQTCSRPSLAEVSTYAFERGGSKIEGPSIRLAEALLSIWSNAEAGWTELSRTTDPKTGITTSQCIAWCFDKQTNVRRQIAFTVPHTRDKNANKNGQKQMTRQPLTSERDIYEMCANVASRRVRACILQVLPGWLVDEALAICRQTLQQDSTPTGPDKLHNLVSAFQTFRVTQAQIESYLKKPINQATNEDIYTLRKIYTTLRDGAADPVDYFSEPPKSSRPVDPIAPITDDIPEFEPPIHQPVRRTIPTTLL